MRRSFFQVFVFLQANYLVSFPHLTYPGTYPWVHTHPSAKMDLEVKISGRSKTHYGLALSFEF